MESLIPKTVTARMLKRGGAERVSDDAKEELARLLEKTAADYTARAVKIAAMEGRNTVRGTDIKRASGNLK